MLQLFNRKKKWNLEEGHIVVSAFDSGGVTYYRLKDTFNSFCFRAMSALDIYDNWQLKKTPEQDIADWKQVLDICNTQPIMLTEIVKLAMLNLENRELILPPEEIIWNMASVMYFDENESPYKYDESYGKEKIKRWKVDKSVDFFLSKQLIGSIIPLPDFSKIDLKNYLQTAEKIRETHNKNRQRYTS